MSKRWQLKIASDLRHLPFVGQFVRESGRAAGLDEGDLFEVELACEEACNNVIEHAYRNAQGDIDITCTVTGSDFVIEIQDQGRPFDPTQFPPLGRRRRPGQVTIGGLGIHLMRELMDVISYRFDPTTGNHLTMIKRGAATRPAPGQN